MSELTKQEKLLVIILDRVLHSPKSLRERVEEFEKVLAMYPQSEIPVEHEFIDGLYRRQVTFPKGMIGTGAIHKTDQMDVMLTGEMLVATPDGFKHLIAPCTFTSRAGNRKAGIAIKETVWISYHPTSATTVAEAEAEILADDYEEIDGECEHVNKEDLCPQ